MGWIRRHYRNKHSSVEGYFLSVAGSLPPVASFFDSRQNWTTAFSHSLLHVAIFRSVVNLHTSWKRALKCIHRFPMKLNFYLLPPSCNLQRIYNLIIMNCTASLPPALSATIKKTAFKTETRPAAIMQTVKAGFISPPETWKADMARVAMLIPLVNAICITEFGVLFHVNPVPQARNRYKSVVKNSAKTSIQKKRESKSVFEPRWRTMFLLVMCEWNRVEKRYQELASIDPVSASSGERDGDHCFGCVSSLSPDKAYIVN